MTLLQTTPYKHSQLNIKGDVIMIKIFLEILKKPFAQKNL
jgi:hypothetical protein